MGRTEKQWCKTRTKISDSAVTQVGPFSVQWQCRFRTLASCIYI